MSYLWFGIKDFDNFIVDCDQGGRGAAAITYFLSSEYIKSKEGQQTDTFWKVEEFVYMDKDVKAITEMV